MKNRKSGVMVPFLNTVYLAFCRPWRDARARDRSSQAGQALILALILLGIGALVTVPTLILSSNALKNSRVITSRAKDFYASDAAQEFTMWKLIYTNYINSFTIQDATDPTKYYSPTSNFTVDVCGSPVKISVIMRAVATWHGVILKANTPIKPTITVSPSSVPDASLRTYTYTIALEQISSNTSLGLDAVYNIIPSPFSSNDYVAGSSQMSLDNVTWQAIGDPLKEDGQTWPTSGSSFGSGQKRLRWPNPVNNNPNDPLNNFPSPIRNFTGGQIKYLRFQLRSSGLTTGYTYYDWAVLKLGTTNILSGADAPLKVGSGATPQDGLIDVTKTSPTSFIPPGQVSSIRYTITVKSLINSTVQLNDITDYLPPGFAYVTGSTNSTMTNSNPTMTFGSVNGVNRWTLDWPLGSSALASGAVKTLQFTATTSENVSGSYYNEVNVVSNKPVPNAFSSPGVSVTQSDFTSGYTWNSAPVIVPAYDTTATSGNVTTNTNLAITTGGGSISSFQIK